MEMADGDRLTPEQAEALSALRDGRNVFLSGNAGTGKSYVLNAFISDLKARNVDFLALAPTGIAALNLTDGSTIHRTLKIAPGVCAPDGPKGSRKVLDAAKVIIIDEISMCRIDLFDHVMGMISQSMTRNGAKQVVLVGDFFQLPPVVTERDSALLMKFYPGNLQGWCFKSRYWTGFDFEPHVLKTVVRQSAPDFIDNLNRARVGDASCLDYFNAHSRSSRAYLPKDTLVLCANNRIADSINRENVDALDAPKVEFTAAVTGMVNSGDKMAPERIVLCRGARVMSLVNSPQEGYVNGTQGTVTDASADAVTVKFDGADEKVRIERHRWEINKSEAIVEMDEEGRPVNRVKTAVVGAYTQIPLKLAYAITIHKSQGLTFDACCVHTKVFDRFIASSSWHHTGAYARETEFFALDEAAVVGAFRELGPEETAERDRIRAQAAARVREAERHRREAECLFEYRFSCSPYSAMAYEAFHPELCERRVSKHRKQELVVYRLPDGSEPSGYAEMSVPADYADSSHVVPSVFISGTGGDRAWRDIDFDEAERKFAAAARRAAAFREGRPKLMQDEARRAAIRETRHRVCTAPILKSIKEIHR